MAKYIALINGVQTEVQPVNSSAGAPDAGKVMQLDAAGLIDVTLLPAAALSGIITKSIVASETIAAGDLINIFDNAGTLNVRKADATDANKPPNGFVLAGISATVAGTVYLGNGINTAVSGLTIGADYFLSEVTPGAVTTVAPSTAGNVIYRVGRASGTTELVYTDDTTPTTLV